MCFSQAWLIIVNTDIDLHICRYCNKFIVRLNKVVYCSCGKAYHPSCANRCTTSLPSVLRCSTSRGGFANRTRNDVQPTAQLQDNILPSGGCAANRELINAHDGSSDQVLMMML